MKSVFSAEVVLDIGPKQIQFRGTDADAHTAGGGAWVNFMRLF